MLIILSDSEYAALQKRTVAITHLRELFAKHRIEPNLDNADEDFFIALDLYDPVEKSVCCMACCHYEQDPDLRCDEPLDQSLVCTGMLLLRAYARDLTLQGEMLRTKLGDVATHHFLGEHHYEYEDVVLELVVKWTVVFDHFRAELVN